MFSNKSEAFAKQTQLDCLLFKWRLQAGALDFI